MLRMVYQDTSERMHGQLWEAVRTGLIFRSEDSYRFLHDRVQEAAYSLIPEELRAEAHLRIGMLMASHTAPDKLEAGIFEIANQLNRGSHLVTSIAEHERIAELNIDRRQARKDFNGLFVRVGVFHPAGLSLCFQMTIGPERYRDCFSTWRSIASRVRVPDWRDLTAAENRISALVAAGNKYIIDKAAVARQRVLLHTVLDRLDSATDIGLEFLGHVGIYWSPHPTRGEVDPGSSPRYGSGSAAVPSNSSSTCRQ